MPSLKDLKNRIASVKSTQKVMKTKQMLAAVSLSLAWCETLAAAPQPESEGNSATSAADFGPATPERIELAKRRGFFEGDKDVAGYCMNVGMELSFNKQPRDVFETWRAELTRLTNGDAFQIRDFSAKGSDILFFGGRRGRPEGENQYSILDLNNLGGQCALVLANGYPENYPSLVGDVFPLDGDKH